VDDSLLLSIVAGSSEDQSPVLDSHVQKISHVVDGQNWGKAWNRFLQPPHSAEEISRHGTDWRLMVAV